LTGMEIANLYIKEMW